MTKIIFLFFFFFATVFAIFRPSDSDGSCEDESRHHGGHGHKHHHRDDSSDEGGYGGGGYQDPEPRCPSGWLKFNRPTGLWCVKVFSGVLTQPDAETACQAQGATLSGLQDENEITQITAQALPLLPSQSSFSIWIGAKRAAACNPCTPLTSFQWTDGSTQGTSGFLWNLLQPDNNFGGTQSCVVLLASTSPVIRDQWTWNANRLDDESCVGERGGALRGVKAYVCGKRGE
ncbi:hypothetical protein GCK72_003494 [Caenorhabditis remanei]|uniref:C-type lectin domain-containing protein n=1 Tax=Caenorhabditis remanei TaxID=31234 RepID=A0A6A5HYA7_CAERE|nr:hypothetical protein GCK72_003494 [Caenorhabditis remanei]KAF1771667.1 hypothetical protein GCK72_003494 [Caenorhabditis remanei]